MPEHQKVQKRSQKYKAFRIKEEMCQKKVMQHMRKCERSENSLIAMRSDFGGCRTKSIRRKLVDAEMAAELQGCRQEKKEEAVMLRKQVMAGLGALWQQLIALGANGIETFVQRIQREMAAAQGQMSGREEEASSEDERKGKGEGDFW